MVALSESHKSNPELLSEISERHVRASDGTFAPRDPNKPRELSQAQLIAIEYLADGCTAVTAGKRAHVNAKTVRNWMKWPEFQLALMTASRERLIEVVPASVQLLSDQVRDKKLNPFARQNAARDILERVGLGREDKADVTQIIVEASVNLPELGQAQEVIVDAEEYDVQKTLDDGGLSSN